MFSTIGYAICIPFAALLRLFYNLTGSYGVSLILFTLVIKLILLPFQMKSKKSMVRMSRMSGKMQEIQKKYANNQMKMQEEMQKFYQEEGFNPMSGCLWSFLPLPILIALYSIIRQPITHFMMLGEDVLHSLIQTAYDAGINLSSVVQLAEDGTMVLNDGVPQVLTYGQINLANLLRTELPEAVSNIDGWINMDYDFLGLNLAANPWDMVTGFQFNWLHIGLILIPILAGGVQLLMSVIMMKQQPQQNASAARSTKMMMYFMPLFSVYIAFLMPAALGVYWIAQSAFSLIQELVLNKFFKQRLEAEETAREEARQADRQKRIEEGRRQQEEQRKQAQTEKKQTLKEKQKAARAAKAAKAARAETSTTEAGRVGNRPYARGRAYKADRYDEEV